MYNIEPDIAGNLATRFASSLTPDDRGTQSADVPAHSVLQRLRQRERELDAARLLSETLFQQGQLHELAEWALRTALDVAQAEAGSVLLADPELRQLVFYHSIGKSPVPPGTRISWDYGIAGAVFHSAKAEIIPDVKRDGRHFSGIDLEVGYATRDMMTLPLKRWGGEPIGVLNVLNKSTHRFTEDDLAIMTILSALISTAIEQKRLAEEAKHGEMLSLVGDIGHDIKNMLDPVVMGLGLLQNGIDEMYGISQQEQTRAARDQCYQVIEIIRSSSRRLQERVHQIAECVKGMDSEPRFAPCRLSSVVEEVLNTLGVLAAQSNIMLRTEGLEDLPPIIADERRLYNAVYNLVNNALPEVRSGGSVTVRGRAGAARVVLSVSDTGRGMPSEVRDSLFTGRAISRKPGGMGLGTRIVKDAVEAHGGTISVDSAIGVGTTFEIRLPICPPQSKKS